MTSYGNFCFKQRERFHPKAAGRADYEARIVWHETKAREMVKNYQWSLDNVLCDPRMPWIYLDQAKSHKRQVVYLYKAATSGERWSDDTPSHWIRTEGAKP